MSEHNPFRPGDEVTYMRWNTGNSNHDEFDAVIKLVLGDPLGHPSIHLSYFDGSARDDNNIPNVEEVSDLSGVDYWKAKFSQITVSESRPFESTRPSAEAGFVWLAKYNSTIGEHEFFPAVVLAILGPGSDQTPRITCFYIDANNDRVTIPNVDAHDDIGNPFTTTENYWADRKSDEDEDDDD